MVDSFSATLLANKEAISYSSGLKLKFVMQDWGLNPGK
jgi:hypothetical protein